MYSKGREASVNRRDPKRGDKNGEGRTALAPILLLLLFVLPVRIAVATPSPAELLDLVRRNSVCAKPDWRESSAGTYMSAGRQFRFVFERRNIDDTWSQERVAYRPSTGIVEDSTSVKPDDSSARQYSIEEPLVGSGEGRQFLYTSLLRRVRKVHPQLGHSIPNTGLPFLFLNLCSRLRVENVRNIAQKEPGLVSAHVADLDIALRYSTPDYQMRELVVKGDGLEWRIRFCDLKRYGDQVRRPHRISSVLYATDQGRELESTELLFDGWGFEQIEGNDSFIVLASSPIQVKLDRPMSEPR